MNLKTPKVFYLTFGVLLFKKYSYLDRLHYMGLLEQEYSYRYIRLLENNERFLISLHNLYLCDDPPALRKKPSIWLTLMSNMQQSLDIAALRIDNCGRACSDAMGRSRKKKLEEMTELERLQQEVNGFSTEDVLLKK